MRPKIKIHSFKLGTPYASAVAWLGKIKLNVVAVFNKLTPKKLALGGVILLVLVCAAQAAFFYWPRSIAFSYSGENCLTRPQLFPKLVNPRQHRSFSATHNSSFAVAGFVDELEALRSDGVLPNLNSHGMSIFDPSTAIRKMD